MIEGSDNLNSIDDHYICKESKKIIEDYLCYNGDVEKLKKRWRKMPKKFNELMGIANIKHINALPDDSDIHQNHNNNNK